MPTRPASSPKPKIKPMAETEWVVDGAGFPIYVRTKDSRHLRVCRAFSLANARLICREHNAALAAKERGA